MKKRIYLYLLFFCQISAVLCYGQNTGCIDSIGLNQFFPSRFIADVSNYANNFLYKPQRDQFDNVYVSGNTDLGGPLKYWSIMKFNAANQLVWNKNYQTDFLSVFKNAGMLHDIESNGNLLFSETVNSGPNASSFWQIISKADNAGNLLWSKIIKHGIDPNFDGGVSTPVLGNNGDLFCVGNFGDDPNKPFIVAFNNTGNMLWNKKYKHITVPKFHRMDNLLISQNSSTLVMAIQYYYNADIPTDPAAKFGVQLIKINKADGAILQQSSFMYYNDAGATIPNKASLSKINYDPVSNRFLLLFKDEAFGIHRFTFTLLDDDFNFIETKLYSSFPNLLLGVSGVKVIIDKSNTITLINANDAVTPQRLLYSVIDKNLNTISQKAIDLTNLGFPLLSFQADLAYKKNGILNFQLATYSNSVFTPNHLFLFDNSAFYNNISPCLGKDSVIYNPVSIYAYLVINPTIEEAGTVPLQITNQFPDFPPVNFTIPKTELCKQVSICDTIKLFGTKYHCLSSPLDSFKIYRNPLCVRKTNWQVDTADIKILSQNDTALYVQYLKAYRGKIKVSFGGCSLTDSIAIEVYNAKTGVNLGNDTMHCPGKTITLKAGNNFKTYLWQDGSSKDSLVAAQPGSYHITATDSCGNIFKDTLLINPFDVVLKADYAKPICPADTATITLPNQLYNYSWLPANAATLNNFSWKLFPASTTIYRITGERLPGCTVSDTVLINVKPICIPDYIYFPNAFTPDNNGRNDTYKPAINGQLLVYEFIIFNRYGQHVFKTNNPTQGWDGKFKNSKNPLSGGYVWSCKYQFAGKMLQQEQGSFVLIR